MYEGSRALALDLNATICALLLCACGTDSHSSNPGHTDAATSDGGNPSTDTGVGGSAGALDGGPDTGNPSCVVPGVHQQRISSGTQQSCAIKGDGSVVCWGVASATASPAGAFVQISSFILTNCGVRTDGHVACWGQVLLPGATPPLDGGFYLAAVGGGHACALDDCGHLTCWGDNRYGQTAAPDELFVDVSAGFVHTCGITNTKRLRCWGKNDFGQSDPPAGEFDRVISGELHSCAIRIDGTVACWGAGNATQVTDGSDSKGLFWGQAIAPSGTFTSLSAGQNHTCGITTSGAVSCWGAGTSVGPCQGNVACGQSAPPTGKFREVAAGFTHTCGIRDTGALACWGSNTDGRATPPTNFP